MAGETYEVDRGETARFCVSFPLGTVLTNYACVGGMRALVPGEREPREDAESVDFTVTSFAGDAEFGPGFYLTLSPTASLATTQAHYKATARITAPGGDVSMANWFVRMVEPGFAEALVGV